LAQARKKSGTTKNGHAAAGKASPAKAGAAKASPATGKPKPKPKKATAKSAAPARARGGAGGGAAGIKSASPKPAKTAAGAVAQRVALAIAEAALDKKAGNVEIIDVEGKVDYADYVVVMSGTSDRQVSALARGISEDVEKKTKSRCLGVEGLPGGAWVLMDFGDVVVHIFHHDVRGYYDLESLWVDAARVPVPAPARPS
jgi:ribosome-associated protein